MSATPPHPTVRRYGAVLATYLAPQWPRVVLLALLVPSGVALQLVGPQLLRAVVDAARDDTATGEALVRTAIFFLGAALAQQGIAVGAAYAGAAVGWAATNGLRADLLAHTLRLDLSFHHARTPGELIDRVDADVSALANFFSQLAVRLASSLLLLVGILVLLFREDWRLGLAFTGFAVTAAALLRPIPGAAAERWRICRQRGAELFGGIGECVEGAEDLRTNGAIGYALRRFFERSRALMRADRAAFMVSSLVWIAPSACSPWDTRWRWGWVATCLVEAPSAWGRSCWSSPTRTCCAGRSTSSTRSCRISNARPRASPA